MQSTEKLSQLQKAILLDLAHGERPRENERARRGKWTGADRAVFSRALRRLELRGLITRTRGRATLTQEGQAIAGELQAEAQRTQDILEAARNGTLDREYQDRLAARLQAFRDAHPPSPARMAKLAALAFPNVPLNWYAVFGARDPKPKRRFVITPGLLKPRR